ncbi:MAG: hypothetical protein P1S60_16825 [Anaerolineae bacterium]|nr:hypothetical protein [Anaerolineae bacterium]
MKTNIKLLGWLHIALGIIGAIIGAFVLFILLGTGLITGDREAMSILTVVGILVAGGLSIISLPGIITGVGLLNFRPWSRVLALVLALLNVFNFPLGTILAIYTFVSLLNSDSAELFTV